MLQVQYEIGDTVRARVTLQNGHYSIVPDTEGVVTGVGLDGTLEIKFGPAVVWVRPWIVQPVCRCCGAELSTPDSACAGCIEFASGEGGDDAA